ncbi:MAG: histidine phosphatase family protein [Actinomycetota bacterium]|nr:histidine phosphatase family protein [Actinomycetota bacterium]
MTTLLLVRHGETEWNRDGRFQGHADPPLSERGREQASALAAELAATPLAAVYSSDLRRAVETAQIVATAKGLAVRALPELREVDVGEWAGLTWEEIERRFPEGVVRHHERGHGWEHGKSYEQMACRVLRALRGIGVRHPRDAVLVVGHGGTMRAIAAYIDRMDVANHRRHDGSRVLNCEVRRIAIENGVLRRMS